MVVRFHLDTFLEMIATLPSSSPTSTTPNQILTSMERGNAQFYAMFRPFAKQFTQTQLIRLAEDYLGGRHFHSSQIGGFAKGTLGEPSPKVFLALGALNTALARSIGHPTELIDEHPQLAESPTLPAIHEPVWRNCIPLLDANNVALGPVGLYEAFCGLRELPALGRRYLHPQEEYRAVSALGSYLRAFYGRHGIDWFDQLDELDEKCRLLRPLLMNDPIPADLLLDNLDEIGRACDSNANVLWGHIETTLGR